MKKYTRWTLLYRFLRQGTFLTAKVYYKKRAISKGNTWPDKRPIIWAPNHQNAFLDGINLSLLTKENPHQIVRGDVFGNKFLDMILNAAHLMPIYRKNDGITAVKKNDVIMQKCYDLLGVNESIVIYPEGKFAPRKKLFALQKGIIRLAFNTALEHGFDCGLIVWPIGINYGDPNKYRTTVYYNLGEAIEIKDYEKAYIDDPKKAERDLLNVIRERMSAVMIDIQEDDIYKDLDFLREIYSYQSGRFPDLMTQFDKGKRLTEKVQEEYRSSPESVEELLLDASKYQKLLKRINMKDWVIKNEKKMSFVLFLKLVGLLLLSPLFFASMALNSPPFYFAKWIADEKIRDFQFKSSGRFAAGDFAFLFWYIIIGTLGFIFLPITYAFLLIPVAFLLINFSERFLRPNWKKVLGRLRFNFNKHKEDFKEAISLKEKIYNELEKLLA